MTWQVWKFAVEPGEFKLELPNGARVLTVQLQGKDPKIWILVDTTALPVTHTFVTIGTGHNADVVQDYDYVGSFQIVDGDDIQLVFHLFHEQPMPSGHRTGTP